MRILILSWRDIRSPFSGGAEAFTYENARRWVKWGHEVTWFTSDFGDCAKDETIEGIRIIRRGTEVTVHYQAFLHYRKLFKGKFDLVIDQINTIPFLTPLYVKEKKIALIFQLARGVWFYETFFPLSLIGFIAEYLYLRIYRNTPVMTISESTKKDLINLGFSSEISILPIGITFKPLEQVAEKESEPTLVFVGRLRKSKRIHHIVQATHLVKNEIPNIRIRIIGAGGRPRYKKKLEYLINKYGMVNNVIFHGYIDEATKQNLIKKSHAIIVTSIREGWGLVVSEANALGTVAIGYNVPGLRDSIIDGQTGMLTKQNNPQELSKAILALLKNENLFKKLCEDALSNSKRFSWQKSAKEFMSILNSI